MIEKSMIETLKALRVEETMSGDEGEPITTMQLDETLGIDDDSEDLFALTQLLSQRVYLITQARTLLANGQTSSLEIPKD